MTVTIVDCAADPPPPTQVRVNVESCVSEAVVSEPLLAIFDPLHAPDAVQLEALLADQVRVEVPPLTIVLGDALNVIEGEGGAGVSAAAVTSTVVD